MTPLTLAQVEAVLDEHAPRWRAQQCILALGGGTITVAMPFSADLMRAGGTIAGPPLMALADRAAYYLTIAHTGAHQAVTANLAIHFLARPEPVDVIATGALIRLGKRTAVSTVDMHAADTLVAHATVTYVLPSPIGTR